MNAEQKRAWLMVAMVIACLVGYLVLLPFLGPARATAAFGLYGISGFGVFIGRRERTDERDKNIGRAATLAGAMASYVAFIAGCMGTWTAVYLFQRHGQVSVHALGMITLLGGMVFFLTRSVAVLVLYGRHIGADNA